MIYECRSTESYEVHNRFTAYLRKSVSRERQKYLLSNQKRAERELPYEENLLLLSLGTNEDIVDTLPLKEQVGNDDLRKAIFALSPDQYHLLYVHAVLGIPYQQYANLFHKNYWTIKAEYLRIVHSLQKIDIGRDISGIYRCDCYGKKKR